MMRSFIASLCLLSGVFGSICVAEDWPNFLGPNGNGKSSETGILTDWSENKLPLLWTLPLDTSYGAGVVRNGRYYQFDRVEDSERLLCLEASTGKEIWHVDQPVVYQDMYGYNNGPRCSPLVTEKYIFTYGVAGRLSCIGHDGKIVWSKNLNQEYGVIQNFFGVSSNPIAYGDLLIVCVGGSPAADQRLPLGRLDMVSGNGSAIVAFGQSDGKEVYRVSDELASYSTPLLTRIDDQDMVFAFMRGGLLAMDPQSGKQHWRFPWRAPRLESVNAAVPVQKGKQILVSECYDIGSALLDVSATKYEVLRKDPESRRLQSFRAHWATPIELDGYLYGCSGRNEPDSDLRCIRWSDGKIAWVHDNRIRSSLLYVDGHFVVLDERGYMELIQATPKKYVPVTHLDLSEPLGGLPGPFFTSPCWAAPILSDGLLYVRGSNRVACFRLIPEKSAK